MLDSPNLILPAWQTFYEIIGSAAGALIGLQFVVIALLANFRRQANSGSIHAFATPTIVHFCWVLSIAAVMTAPWPRMSALAVTLLLLGACGMGYAVIVFRRTSRQTGYKPVAEDWIWYTILPFGVYAVLTATAVWLWCRGPGSGVKIFVIAAAALSLLLIGIHNSWDSVTHLVVNQTEVDTKADADRHGRS